MVSALTYENSQTNAHNKVLLSLVAVVGVAFLALSYYTDTLGKFTGIGDGSSMTLLPVEMDSYGSLCAPNYNYGGSSVLIAMMDSSGCRYGASAGDKQIYMKFDTGGLGSISSATLFLKSASSDQYGEFVIYPISKKWDESNVRWNGPSEKSYWSSPGLALGDLEPSTYVRFTVNNPDEYIIVDVTALLKYWTSGNDNEGIVIKSIDGMLELFSKESGYPAFIVVK